MKTRSAVVAASLSLMMSVGLGGASAAAEPGLSAVPTIRIEREVGAVRNLALETGQNRLLILTEPIGRVSVADPRIADLKVITPVQLLLTSRGVGTTDLTLWNKRDEPLVLALQVTRNLDRLKTQLADLFPEEKITVSTAGDLVVLSGEVSDVRGPGARGRGRPAPLREGGEPDQGRGQPAGAAGGQVRRGLALRSA